jgi:aspartyl protease family protein
MLVASFILGIFALTFVFDDLLDKQVNPNESPQYFESVGGLREVHLQQNRQGHYVASGLINDIPVTFLLDTGATDVAIPAPIAQAAGLRAGNESRAYTANGSVAVYSTRVDTLIIGNIVLHDIPASITPSMAGDTILLGMSALRQIEFTQRGDRLTLRQLPETY